MNEKDTGQMLRQMFEYGKFGNGRIYENSLMGLIMTLNYWVDVGLDYRKLHMRISEVDKFDKKIMRDANQAIKLKHMLFGSLIADERVEYYLPPIVKQVEVEEVIDGKKVIREKVKAKNRSREYNIYLIQGHRIYEPVTYETDKYGNNKYPYYYEGQDINEMRRKNFHRVMRDKGEKINFPEKLVAKHDDMIPISVLKKAVYYIYDRAKRLNKSLKDTVRQEWDYDPSKIYMIERDELVSYGY